MPQRKSRSKSRTPAKSRSRSRSQKRSRSAIGSKIVGSNQPQLQAMLTKALTPKLSQDGVAFLKCALATPDFSIDPGRGIPDKYTGRTVNIKDCFTTSVTFGVGDTYIVIAPVPGYAYFTTTVAEGATPTTFTGVKFPTYDSNFGPILTATQGPNQQAFPSSPSYNKFRYASLAAGVYPTSNMMQYGGAISCWKGDLSLAETAAVVVQGVDFTGSTTTKIDDVTVHKLAGTNSITTLVPRDNYTESFIKGAYSVSMDNSGDFEWSDFLYDIAYESLEGSLTTVEPIGERVPRATFTGAENSPLTGWGNNESIIYKVSTATGNVNTATLKIWNCLEMQVNTNSNVYQYSHPSPHFDAAALAVYARIRNELPVAVPCAQNADFWKRVMQLVRGMFSAASMIPGPIGMVGTGMTALLT